MFTGGKWLSSSDKMDVLNPYNGEVIGRVSKAGEKDMEEAINSSHKAFSLTKKTPSYLRSEVLKYIAKRIKEEREDFAKIISLEAGKPVKDARLEVDRGINTFTIASEEVSRIGGEYVPLDLLPSSVGRFGITKRFPRGPVAAISPFNFPLNLVAHKVAPSIASGNSVIIKPSSTTPMTALKLAGILAETDWPSGGVNALACPSELAEKLATDERIKILSFTGSPAVGWHLKRLASKKQVILELGGNAGVIVHDDTNLDMAVKRCVLGSFSFAGQICISVQRIYIQNRIYDSFLDKFLEYTKSLKIGDPLEEDTDIGPMINPAAVEKTKEFLREAVDGGAGILLGGHFDGNLLEPSVIINVEPAMKIYCEEAFAPVVCISSYDTFEEAVSLVDDSPYGLQCGIFTNDIKRIVYAFENIEVGGVIINDIPTFRVDHMPYGGVKDSGFGREGLRYAIEEMTELKLLAFNML